MDHHSMQIDRKGLWVLALVVMVIITMGASILTNNEVTLIIDGQESVYNTTVETVGDLLEEEEIDLEANTYIEVDLDEPIVNGLEVEINTPQDIIILDNHEEIIFRSGYKSVEEILRQADINVDKEDYTVPSIKGEIVESAHKEPVIIINRVERNLSVTTEPIEFDKITEENPEMYKGEEKIITAGQMGERTITTEVVNVNSEESDSRVVDSKVTKEPVTEVKQIGTKERPVQTHAAGGKGSLNGKNVVRTITMEATAYDPSPASNGKWAGITALGTKLRPGVVAVDRNVIPLGTRLYVESNDDWPDYGNAVAEDVGGAIKGNRIDLLFMDRDTCRRFGRRTVTVHVLAD